MINNLDQLKPELPTPFPKEVEVWTCPKTGWKVPKGEMANLAYREKILRAAEKDEGFQADIMAACKESLLLWVNAFSWTFHQMDVKDGQRIISTDADVPFITWEVQDRAFTELIRCLGECSNEEFLKAIDILFDKSRDMGASWVCINFIHWLWLYRENAQMLELSRTEDYVDKPGNMKALFQRHDYINIWLPAWMTPPDCGYNQKYRTKMHMKNALNGACIDGESTTQHAASGDRRIVSLLDEFAKVEKGALMRSATRDASLVRIVNSTGAGPGTEYSKWKKSGMIKVFPLMWWDHPDKGKGRYLKQDPVTKAWKIRSPWYDAECLVRSPKEMAREIDAIDVEAGSMFFTIENIDKHIALFGREPKSRWDINWKKGISDDKIKNILRRKDVTKCMARRRKDGPLRIWTNLVSGRPDQTKDYIFGIDISKGQGASNSVVSIKCKQTKEKIAEWRDANTPPYELVRVAAALALWVGGRRKLPHMKWEMNLCGWDFGEILVKKYCYPYYYRNVRAGDVRDKKSKKFGWHANTNSKALLLANYDRALAHGNYFNHSIWGLEEAKMYINYPSGGIGPACMVEENQSARKTHGDVVIADALTVEDKDARAGKLTAQEGPQTMRSAAYRRKIQKEKHGVGRGKKRFDFRR
ncbi:hypothetical protein LCGC14_0355630 [marine sediment metagenome]|uniref:Terminase n=1 Tax=marine sediment metagenome TaxID=412755 RepID=A0A0F9VWK0_9ZZZZ